LGRHVHNSINTSVSGLSSTRPHRHQLIASDAQDYLHFKINVSFYQASKQSKFFSRSCEMTFYLEKKRKINAEHQVSLFYFI